MSDISEKEMHAAAVTSSDPLATETPEVPEVNPPAEEQGQNSTFLLLYKNETSDQINNLSINLSGLFAAMAKENLTTGESNLVYRGFEEGVRILLDNYDIVRKQTTVDSFSLNDIFLKKIEEKLSELEKEAAEHEPKSSS